MIDLRDTKNQNPTVYREIAKDIPLSSTTFFWGENMYYTAVSGAEKCPVPNTRFDGANCFIYTPKEGEKPGFSVKNDDDYY